MRGGAFAAAMLASVVAGAARTAFLDDITVTPAALLLVVIGVLTATAITYAARWIGQRTWHARSDAAARREALFKAVSISSFGAVFGWSSDAFADEAIVPAFLLIDVGFHALLAGLLYLFFRRLATPARA